MLWVKLRDCASGIGAAGRQPAREFTVEQLQAMSDADPNLTSPSETVGALLDGKYRLVREIGAGAMGRVLEAHHAILDKPVAVKFLTATGHNLARKRFVREAQTAQALTSEHVVRVFDVGFTGDAAYIVMEYLKGEDLSTLVGRRGPLPMREAVDYILQACHGLAEAHVLGIVHRDIKPSNLFLTATASGEPLIKVVDFGISKVREGSNTDGEATASGAMLGSPYFMSPEQLRDPSRVDGRTDVWALAITLFNLLTNDHPFRGVTLSGISASIFTDPPPKLTSRRADLPVELESVLERALEKHPEQRTKTVAQFAAELTPFASNRGRLTAERLSSWVDGGPASAKLSPETLCASGTATDDRALGSLNAVSRESQSTSAASADRVATGAPGRVSPLVWVLAAAVVLVLGGLAAFRFLPRSSDPASASPIVKDSEAKPQNPSVFPAVSLNPSVPDVAPTTTTEAPARTEARPVRAQSRPPAQPRQTPSAQPPPAVSATPAPPKPANVDVDGVPIVR